MKYLWHSSDRGLQQLFIAHFDILHTFVQDISFSGSVRKYNIIFALI